MEKNRTHYPGQVILEITSKCNLRCKGCVFHGPDAGVKRASGLMKRDIWQKIVDEIGGWPINVNLTTHGGGEPLLYPDLGNLLEYAKQYTNIETGFLTNAMLLTKQCTETILNTGINWIAFSVDGVEHDNHAKVRTGSDLKIIEENILFFLERAKQQKKAPRTLMNMVLYPEVKKEREAFLHKWLGKIDTIRMSHYRYPPWSRRWPNVAATRQPCTYLWSQTVISWDGRIGLCCEDWNIEVETGDVAKDTLVHAFNSELMHRYREAHNNSKFDELTLCAKCDTWADGFPVESFDKKRGIRIIQYGSGVEYKLMPKD